MESTSLEEIREIMMLGAKLRRPWPEGSLVYQDLLNEYHHKVDTLCNNLVREQSNRRNCG